MEVDPKSMSLGALIAKDKGNRKPAGDGGLRGGHARRGRGGFRER